MVAEAADVIRMTADTRPMAKWAAAKLYPIKTPITAADLLNDWVLPFFDEQGMGVLRILTKGSVMACQATFSLMLRPVRYSA